VAQRCISQDVGKNFLEKVKMKNFKEVTFRKGSEGFLSSTGEYGYWYPNLDNKVTVQEDIDIEHLYLWKNQDPYFAFRVPSWALNLNISLSKDVDVCIWFHEKSIIVEKGLMPKIV